MLVEEMIERLSPNERRKLWKEVCDSFRSEMANIKYTFENMYPGYEFVKVDKSGFIHLKLTEIMFCFTVIGKDTDGNEKSFDFNTFCKIPDVRLVEE